MITDITCFTNKPGYALLDRFKKTLKHVKYFDVLVGYFRSSRVNYRQKTRSWQEILHLRKSSIWRFCNMSGKEQYLHAIRELEEQLYHAV